MSESGVRSLTAMPAGWSGTVVGFSGGRGFQSRLVSMGVHVGLEIRVIRSGHVRGGPMLIAAGGARLAIGHGMARKIMVAMGSA